MKHLKNIDLYRKTDTDRVQIRDIFRKDGRQLNEKQIIDALLDYISLHIFQIFVTLELIMIPHIPTPVPWLLRLGC